MKGRGVLDGRTQQRFAEGRSAEWNAKDESFLPNNLAGF